MANYSQNLTHTKVWHVVPESIDDAEMCEKLMRWLSAEERARMQRFHAVHHRHAYLIGHALVRGALARELDCDPAELKFETNAYGKPSVVLSSSHPKLEFNLSHTEGLSVVAVSRFSRVGCDVECLKRSGLDVEIARRFFTQEESQEIAEHPPEQQIKRLLSYWTLKEAYIKAEGQGLSLGLDTFFFSLVENQSPRLMLKSSAQQPSADWQFMQTTLSGHYLFSLAIEPINGVHMPIEIDNANWLGR